MSEPRGASKVRHVRVSDQLWQAFAAKVDSEGANLSEILRELIRDYVRDGRR